MRILVVGDTHCNYNFTSRIVREAFMKKCSAIVQVGDFGYWPNIELGSLFLYDLNGLLSMYGIDLFWIDGNHEHHDILLDILGDHNQDGFIPIKCGGSQQRVFHIPRGNFWEWDGKVFAGLGGSYSIDWNVRTIGVDWFEREVISYADMDLTVSNSKSYGKPWIMFSHDAPAEISIPGILPIPEAYLNRERLSSVIAEVMPENIIHGHYHTSYYSKYTLQGEEDHVVGVYGLDCDRPQTRSIYGTYVVVDTETGTIE